MEPAPYAISVRVVKTTHTPPGKARHRHAVTQIIECECGCSQLELFAAGMADLDPCALLDSQFTSGRAARTQLGHLSTEVSSRYPDLPDPDPYNGSRREMRGIVLGGSRPGGRSLPPPV